MVEYDVNPDDAGTRVPYSVRLPAELHAALKAVADERGESMNGLITAAVADLVDRPELGRSRPGRDLDVELAATAVAGTGRAVGPLKTIAKQLLDRGEPILSSVLYAAAATVIEHSDSQEAAAAELIRTGRVVQRVPGATTVASALYRRALTLDPSNLEAANLLGQQRHHEGQRGEGVGAYREAIELLRNVAAFDNHAKLFLGWSTLELGRSTDDEQLIEQGLATLGDALRAWAFGDRDERQRDRWLRQLQRLTELGYGGRVEELRSFANRHTGWDEIDAEEVTA